MVRHDSGKTASGNATYASNDNCPGRRGPEQWCPDTSSCAWRNSQLVVLRGNERKKEGGFKKSFQEPVFSQHLHSFTISFPCLCPMTHTTVKSHLRVILPLPSPTTEPLDRDSEDTTTSSEASQDRGE